MFTAKVQYALILLKELCELQRNGNIGPVKLQEIADKHGLKTEFLEQVARKLRLKKYVVAVKGPGGGYVLGSNKGDLISIMNCVQGSDLKLAASGDAAKEYIKDLHEEYLELVSEIKL